MVSNSVDLNESFKFVFRDEEWVTKILVGGFLYLSIIGLFPVLGWAMEIQRRVIRGEESTLPDWDDLKGYSISGLKLSAASFVWSLPYTLLICALFLPIIFLPYAEENNWFISAYFLGIFFFQSLFLLLSMGYIIWIYPLLSGLIADKGTIRSALSLSTVFRLLKVNFWQITGVGFLAYVVYNAASMLGFFLLFIGIFFTTPIAMAIAFHLYGQVYKGSLSMAKFTDK